MRSCPFFQGIDVVISSATEGTGQLALLCRSSTMVNALPILVRQEVLLNATGSDLQAFIAV